MRLKQEIAGYQADQIGVEPGENSQDLSGTLAVIRNPADNDCVVGKIMTATADDVHHAAEQAHRARQEWDELGGEGRAKILERVADLLEGNQSRLMALLSSEAGKSLPDGLAEVREAVDFCRYYAGQARDYFSAATALPGPTGENNELSLHGRGTFVCISPWNFPLAIFTGQVAAVLAAGNPVLAKPAEQTPLIAFEAVKLMHQAGVPAEVLHLLPGDGAVVGPMLTTQPLISGVVFTGSTATAKIIHRALANRPGPIVPLIAETGGQNVMFVDSTALLEQVTDDVIRSAFISAGQRCSALRVLYLQEEIADRVCQAHAQIPFDHESGLSTCCNRKLITEL
ncbi:MAG: aldehyde dehydrogenase family protein [Gammaproteobacteria bacterium]|nr:aldehyde dehydrogenase family protein [Gammaproteobacteria bacterium]